MAHPIRKICPNTQDISNEGEEDGDAVGDEDPFGLVHVDVGWGCSGDVCEFGDREERVANEAKSDV